MDYIELDDFDLERSIHDQDYTKRAISKMNQVLYSDSFFENSPKATLEFLSKQFDMVSFGDQLKRYIYEQAGIEEPFAEVEEQEYIELIKDAFEENCAPHSFQPTTRSWTTIVKSFVRNKTITRSVMFLIAFGLNMSDDEVSTFLTKILLDLDFNFRDPKETIFWFCYHKEQPYYKAKELMDYYENSEGIFMEESQKSSIEMNPKVYLSNEEILRQYLDAIKYGNRDKGIYDVQHEILMSLYGRCIAIIRDIYSENSEEYTKNLEQIGPSDIEKILYAGIPVNAKGNLEKMSVSILGTCFDKKRLTRQRMDQLIHRKINVDRFDIITLLFFIYATSVELDYPAERQLQYIDEINDLLNTCHFIGLYPVNPYDAFILMCLLSDDSIYSFNEVWAMSYEEKM